MYSYIHKAPKVDRYVSIDFWSFMLPKNYKVVIYILGNKYLSIYENIKRNHKNWSVIS